MSSTSPRMAVLEHKTAKPGCNKCGKKTRQEIIIRQTKRKIFL